MLKLLRSPLVMLLSLVATCILLWSLWGTVKRSRSSAEQVGLLEQELHQMASEVSRLEQKVSVASSAAAQEKIIRNELLMQKPGEYVVQLPPLETTTPTPTPAPSLSPWQGWQQVLGLR